MTDTDLPDPNDDAIYGVDRRIADWEDLPYRASDFYLVDKDGRFDPEASVNNLIEKAMQDDVSKVAAVNLLEDPAFQKFVEKSMRNIKAGKFDGALPQRAFTRILALLCILRCYLQKGNPERTKYEERVEYITGNSSKDSAEKSVAKADDFEALERYLMDPDGSWALFDKAFRDQHVVSEFEWPWFKMGVPYQAWCEGLHVGEADKEMSLQGLDRQVNFLGVKPRFLIEVMKFFQKSDQAAHYPDTSNTTVSRPGEMIPCRVPSDGTARRIIYGPSRSLNHSTIALLNAMQFPFPPELYDGGDASENGGQFEQAHRRTSDYPITVEGKMPLPMSAAMSQLPAQAIQGIDVPIVGKINRFPNAVEPLGILDQVRSITVPLYANPMWEGVEYRAISIQYPTLFGVGPHGHVIFNPNQRLNPQINQGGPTWNDLLTERLVIVEPVEGVLELTDETRHALGSTPSLMIGHVTYADKTRNQKLAMKLWAPSLDQPSSNAPVMTQHQIEIPVQHIDSIFPVIAIIP